MHAQVFKTCIDSCNHPHKKDTEQFHYLPKSPCAVPLSNLLSTHTLRPFIGHEVYQKYKMGRKDIQHIMKTTRNFS